jgi:DNA-binding CsgD family transcriptional regulator
MTVRVGRKSRSSRPLTAAGSVDELVRKLVSLAVGTDATRAGNTSPHVLVDTEIEGVRCVLTRPSAAPARSARTDAPVAQRRPDHALTVGVRANTAVRLSPREREIGRMVALGYPNKIIADVLDISLWTVGTHLRRMFAKFGVTSRAAMVASAIAAGALEDRAGPEPGQR